MSILPITLRWRIIPVVLLALTVLAYIYFHPAFGGNPDAASLAKIQASKHHNGITFQNLEPTGLIAPDGKNYPTLARLVGYFTPPEDKNPTMPLPSEPLRVDKPEGVASSGSAIPPYSSRWRASAPSPTLFSTVPPALRRKTIRPAAGLLRLPADL